MTRLLYDLCATGDQRFSPYCWRAKLALRHKGLDYETVPVRFSDKHKIAFSGQDKMPVLDDGGTVVFDSFAIAEYLEAAYPEAPSLFPGANGRQLARMTNDWADGIHRELLSFVVYDIYGRLQV
ncbi:MAG: glutathione S-transferase N-terminal domain-containing protein, partial [Magnetovibrio sp.]|nr:glutathione S-transferase N-terminal domain-containing protein [Magnetovibrio sp.]